jgi:hypothetical protein
MTEAEQREVKALIAKTVAESAKIAAQLEARIAQLQAEVERKNKALEGFIGENEALKKELAGPKAEDAPPSVQPVPANNNSELSPRVAAKLGKWMKSR